MNDNKSAIQAMSAAFLALGMAVSESTLRRAGSHLQELLAHGELDAPTSRIIEGILVGIDYDEEAIVSNWSDSDGALIN